ncbi:transposase [Streptomyces canus]|uniref:transposase n=1 Tax=Streptomyces canus TaxID=58343 RepID=UPI002257D3D9|nr:transposase [Streptomyces canus]MCX5254979.1 transposase [Streptomyces canus]
MAQTIGRVLRDRFDVLVNQSLQLVKVMTGCQFALGDAALEISPLRTHGGNMALGEGEELGVESSLRLFAEEIGLSFHTVRTYRWVAARWSKDQRQEGVSFEVHRIRASARRSVPVDFGIPWRTVFGLFQRWRASRDLARIHAEPHKRVRLHDGLNPRTVAVILDSQSVKGSETVGQEARGVDGGKLINGRKRHLIVDMRGMPLTVMVGVAVPHDSVPARDLLFRLRLTHPEVTVAWADSAYGGTLVGWSRSALGLTLKTVPRRKDRDGFAVLAKRWRVERAISWIMRARRNLRDYERLISHSEAHLTWTFASGCSRTTPSASPPPPCAEAL